MATTCIVERPDGTTYRARLEPVAEYWTEGDDSNATFWVTVYRTHNLDQARELAHKEMRAHGETGDTLTAGERVWLRKSPALDGPMWERVESSKRGSIPCVVFRIEEA